MLCTCKGSCDSNVVASYCEGVFAVCIRKYRSIVDKNVTLDHITYYRLELKYCACFIIAVNRII